MKIYQSGMVIVVRQKLHIGISTTYHVEWISMGPHRPSMAGTSPFLIYVPGINLHLDRGFSQAHPKNHRPGLQVQVAFESPAQQWLKKETSRSMESMESMDKAIIALFLSTINTHEIQHVCKY